MANERQFLNGVFADKKNGSYGEYFDLHIPDLGRFIENLKQFKTNSKGGLRFRMTEQQTPGKMSIYFNDWEPTGLPGAPQQLPQRTPSPSAGKPAAKKPAPATNSDDLPF